MFKNAFILVCSVIVITTFGCGSNSQSSTTSNSNANVIMSKEIKLDPANMPAGLSGSPVPPSANMPPGISVNAAPPPSGKTTPGIPSAEELKKGFKPGKMSTPGIPDQETIRKQMGLPVTNVNAPATGDIPMMKSKRQLGGKPQ